MFVVTAAGAKGGSSRSLTCVNLAVEAGRAHRKAAIIDIDPQCTSMSWKDAREATTPMVASVTPARLCLAVEAAREDGFDFCIIDTPPHSSDATIQAAELSDLLLIPCRPWVFDLRTLATTSRIVKLTGKPAYVVISQAPHSTKQVEEAREAIGSYGLDVAPVIVHQRASFAHGTTMGFAASEWEPNGKAAGEMKALWQWLSATLDQLPDRLIKRSNDRSIKSSSDQMIGSSKHDSIIRSKDRSIGTSVNREKGVVR